MPEYLAPGVYVEEVELGPKPIAGVSTSTAGFLGKTERGPTDPQLLTSFADYRRMFGGFTESNLGYAVDGFFRNGGSRCYVGRVTAATETASSNLSGYDPQPDELGLMPKPLDFGIVSTEKSVTRSVTLRNLGGSSDGAITVTKLEISEDNAGEFSIPNQSTVNQNGITLDPGETTEVEVQFEPTNSGTKSAKLEVEHDGTTSASPATVSLEAEGVSPTSGVLAVSPMNVAFGSVVVGNEPTRTITLRNLGSSGESPITISSAEITVNADDFAIRTEIPDSGVDIAPGDSTDLEVSATPENAGTKSGTLEVKHDGSTPNSPISVSLKAEAEATVLDLTAVGPGPWGTHIAVIIEDATLFKPDENQLFKATVRYWADDEDLKKARIYDADTDVDEVPTPDVEEVYDNLSPVESSSNYYETQISNGSTIIKAKQLAGGRPANSGGTPTWLDESFPSPLPTVEPKHYEGDGTKPPGQRTGLVAFEEIDNISIVCIPDENDDSSLTDAVVTHCENMGDRFAVIQAKQSAAGPSDLSPPVVSEYAAFYYPWIEVPDPETSVSKLIPPGGHVVGVYARSDAERGVHKAPANEVLRGVQKLQFSLTKGDQEVLNPKGVNCLRSFPGRGIRVWGARTTSSDPVWKYVNVRRLFLYVEESIEEGTQWVVFEPNSERLWARVRQSVSNFLTTVWRDGALMGTTPEEAFYVKCDRSTMTQNDINNGRLIAEIGIAPVKPAEFVVFRISQWTGDAES